MAVNFINISKREFLKNHSHLYRYTTIERLLEQFFTKKFVFVNPSQWSDPFEKFFLDREYLIDSRKFDLPMKDNIFCLCFSGTLSSEAYWKVYAPKENGVRLNINAEKLIEVLEKLPYEIFVGEVIYQTTENFYKINFDIDKLVDEIEEELIGEQQIKLLLKKRKSFLYENEVRIIVVPDSSSKKIKETKLYVENIDLKIFTTDFIIGPRMKKFQVKLLKEVFLKKYDIKLAHSRLYAEIPKDKIKLVKK